MLDKIKAEIEQIEPYDLPWDKRTPEHIRDMAVEIVEKYAEQEPCDDVVSRQAVLKIIDGWYEQNRDTENIEDLIVLITYMDSVRPQEQTREEQALLQKWRDNRGISMKEFAEAMKALQEPQEGGANNG